MGPGHVVDDRFVVEGAIGSGGMGTVYRAHDRSTDEKVALKLLSRDDASDRFDLEVKVLAGLEHPHIVRYVAHGELDGGPPYLAMEWLEGEDLEARIARGPLAEKDVLALATAVADVLSVTHAKGIVHRDIKPANLFLPGGDPAKVKVLDFGIARTLGGSSRLTGTGVLVGTPAYMAPEQARGDRHLDARVDVFALGCVLFEASTGRPAFAGEHAVAVLAKILLEEAPRVVDVSPGASPGLSSLVAKLLAKPREERPSDGAAVLTLLDALESGVASAEHAEALGRAERRMLSVVITAAAGTLDDTLLPGERSLAERRALALVAAHQGRLHVLANGSMLAVLEGGGSPTDQAVSAARIALGLGEILAATPIALATGRAVLGGPVPTGEAIDRAVQRLVHSDAASRSGVRVDPVTASLLDRRFRIEGGRDDLYLVGESDVVDATRTLLGRPTLFVGRDREVANVVGTLEECCEESMARAVLITAPVGMGKSRLCHEVVRRVQEQHTDVEVLFARGDAVGAGAPFAIAAQLLRRAADVSDDDSAEQKRNKLSVRIERHLRDSVATRVTEFLLEIADAGVPVEVASVALGNARRDPAIMADLVRVAWDEWLAAECAEHPLLLVVEDLHWGDLPSVRLMDSALRKLRDAPVLLLATARPEVHTEFPGLWAERQLSEIRLGPVGKRAAERFVRNALGDASDDDVRFIVERAAGHPFYLEELVRALQEGRRRDELPESVLGMVQARLDAQGAEGRRVLRAAAVFGKSFRHAGVAHLLGVDPASISARIDDLVRKELLEMRGDRELAFRHSVIRDAAYEMLTERDRATGHRLAAEWLERDGGHEPSVLALHFDRSGLRERALGYYRRAAELALDGNDVSGSIALAQRALECGATGEDAAELYLLMADAEFWRGDLRRSQELGELAASGFVPGSESWFTAAERVMVAAGQRGDNDLVEVWLHKAIPLEAEPSSLSAQVLSLCRGISQITYAHRHATAQRGLERVGELVARSDDLDLVAAAWVKRVRGEAGLFFQGDLWVAACGFEAATKLFDQSGALRAACQCRLMESNWWAFAGLDAKALELAERGFAEAEELGSQFLVHFAQDCLTMVHYVAGRSREALQAAERGLEAMQGSSRTDIAMRVVRAICKVDLGMTDAAEAEARSVVELARNTTVYPFAMSALVKALTAMGRLDEAVALGRDAHAVEASAPVSEAFQGVGGASFAAALRAAGRTEEAREVTRATLERLQTLARTIPDAEVRRAYWRRSMPNAELVALAKELGVPLDGIL